jgi:uncharacterized protein DUF4157
MLRWFNAAQPASRAILQTKLAVNVPGDQYEQEAERVSEQVMRVPESQVQRACACGGSCADCQNKSDVGRLQMKSISAAPTAAEAPPSVHEVLRSSGQPLDSTARAFMEPRFGHDFSDVRVHTGSGAAESARDVRASAYTVGRHIVFSGDTGPHHRALLAHELSHVLQQRERSSSPSTRSVQRQSPGSGSPPSGSPKFFDVSRGPLTGDEKEKLLALRKKYGLPVEATEDQSTIVGILILENGEELDFHSGEFGGYHAGVRRNEIRGGRGSGATRYNRTHVESWAAEAMRNRGAKKAVLLIEKEPCAVCGGYGKGHPETPTKTPTVANRLPEDAQLLVVDDANTTYFRSVRTAPTPAPEPPPTKEPKEKPKSAERARTEPTTTEPAKAKPAPAEPKAEPPSRPTAKTQPPATRGEEPAPISRPKPASPPAESEPVGLVGSRKSPVEFELSTYPRDQKGPIVGRFNDVVTLGTVVSVVQTAVTVVSLATGKDISPLGFVEWHFNGEIDDAAKDLEAGYPAVGVLRHDAGLDQYAKSYVDAINQLKLPGLVLAVAAVGAVGIPEKDREAYFKSVVENYLRAGGAAGRWQNYVDASKAYLDAASFLEERIGNTEWYTLPKIADDIRLRASVLTEAGDKLDQTFYSLLQYPAAWFGPGEFAALEIQHVAGVFHSLGDRLGSLSAAIAARHSDYQNLWNELENGQNRVYKDQEMFATRFGMKVPR